MTGETLPPPPANPPAGPAGHAQAVRMRAATDADWPALWPILQATFAAGETYAVPADIGEDDARQLWMRAPQATFVAIDAAGALLGSYYIKPNQGGGGRHVANAGYVVDARAAGRGVASQMCEHSQREALARGFLAMQFNFVVSTNTRAVALWQRMGFGVVGRLPRAFAHPRHGLVDALVMFKWLGAGG